jgi:23S rRNA (pseudouridine1915-N3)-methyltransferase
VRIELLFTGKTKQAFVEEGMSEYIKRIGKYITLTVNIIPDQKITGKQSRTEIRKKEGVMILKKLKPRDYVVLLDERGAKFSSGKFAEFLAGKLMSASGNLVFVAGGAEGFSEEVYMRKDFMISLSPMTFSHQMIRLIFLEQLYRAFTIIHNEPYHLGH